MSHCLKKERWSFLGACRVLDVPLATVIFEALKTQVFEEFYEVVVVFAVGRRLFAVWVFSQAELDAWRECRWVRPIMALAVAATELLRNGEECHPPEFPER